jgi:hypothetical protein
LTDLDNKAYPTFADYRGKVVLLMAVQYNCGGCKANAPRIGKIADSLGAGHASQFQAMGVDINFGTVANLRTFDLLLKQNASTVSFPLLRGLTRYNSATNPTGEIRDSLAPGTTTVIGTLWIPYYSLRDVFFVIDAAGKIVYRLNGNRSNAVTETDYRALANAITTALNSATGIQCIRATCFAKHGLSAYRQGNGFRFTLDPAKISGPVSMRILDLHGRVISDFSVASGGEGIWDGLDSRGNSLPFGAYFLRATGKGLSISQPLNR